MRLLLVILAIAAFAGGLYYTLAIYLPRQKYGPAQSEIARWEERLAAVRECLIGPKPGSPKLREALAIYQLSGSAVVLTPRETRERRAAKRRSTGTPCARRIGELARGEPDDTRDAIVETSELAAWDRPARRETGDADAGVRIVEDTGLPRVETAWDRLERAVSALAKAYVNYIDPLPSDSPPVRDPFEVAFEQLDAAHAALRETARLPPAPAADAVPPLSVAQVIPVRPTDGPLTTIEKPLAMDRAFVPASTERQRVWIALQAGAAPVTSDVAPGVIPAAGGARWGALTEGDQVKIGSLDESGLPQSTEAANDPHAIAIEDDSEVLAVTGTADNGLVLIHTMTTATRKGSFTLVHSKAGKLVADKPIEAASVDHAIHSSGRMLVTYGGVDDSRSAFISDGAAPPKVFQLGQMSPDHVCMGAARGWIADVKTRRTVTLDATNFRDVPSEGYFRGCNDGHALFEVSKAHYQICAETCRDVIAPESAATVTFVLAGDRVAGASARDQVVAVWRERAPPAFYAMDQPRTILFALSDGKVIDLITKSRDGVAIVRIPAT